MKGTHGLAYAAVILFVLACQCAQPQTNQNNSTAPAAGTTPANVNSATAPSPTEAPITATAQQLARDYEANEISADGRYKDKILRVTGTVESIQEVFGQQFVTLRGQGLTSIQCFFDASQTGALSTLRTGQRATIQGRCDGKSINVTLQECTIP